MADRAAHAIDRMRRAAAEIGVEIGMRRERLSKKLENFEAAVALHFAYYNFVRSHKTIRMTPAMAAGIERNFWTVADLIEAAS